MPSRIGPEHLRDLERRGSLRFVLPRQEDVTLIVDGRPYQCKLEDISIGGAKLRLAESIPASDDLRLEHAVAGAIDGVGMWRNDGTIGVSFALTDPALRLISLCLRQGLPSGTFAA